MATIFTHMKIVAAGAAAAFLLGGTPASADTYNSAQRTSSHTLHSDVLAEDREIFVRVPPGYETQDKAFPIVYVLDGEWNFELVAAYLDYMIDNHVYPEVIVVGVRNVNRNRDYVPRSDPNFLYTGGADAFLSFIENEWTAFMGANYRTSGERILIGHSFGGVFTLHALFKRPELFDAYIALGSSAWVSDRVLFEEAEAFFADAAKPDAFVYMAVGEGDGGPTVPSSTDLASLFKQKAPESLEWTYAITPKTDHFKNFASGMHEGFMELFPAWRFPEDVKARAETEGAAGIDSWFEEQEAKLGYRFIPAWFDLGVAAMALARENHDVAAVALMTKLKRYHPNSPYIASFFATVHDLGGRFDMAEREILRAIALAEETGGDPNAIQVEKLKQTLSSIREKRTAAEHS